MNWSIMRRASWLDTRARFVDMTSHGGTLLDLGASDGGTLRHFAELRPDLTFAAADIEGKPEAYPRGTDFKVADFDRDRFPWPDASFDAITCMHVVEHLQDPTHLIRESHRLLRPGGRIYIETPAPKTVDMTSATGSAKGRVTVNFFDDPTHVRPVPVGDLQRIADHIGFHSVRSGVSRNWIFTAAYPLLRIVKPDSRNRYVAQIHWTGWSEYIVATK